MALLVRRSADCVDPRSALPDVSGTVSQFQSTNINVTVSNASGKEKQLATRATANMAFEDGDKEVPDVSECATSVKVNGSEIFLVGENVYKDHDILNSGSNNSVTYSPK